MASHSGTSPFFPNFGHFFHQWSGKNFISIWIVGKSRAHPFTFLIGPNFFHFYRHIIKSKFNIRLCELFRFFCWTNFDRGAWGPDIGLWGPKKRNWQALPHVPHPLKCAFELDPVGPAEVCPSFGQFHQTFYKQLLRQFPFAKKVQT